MKVIILAGGLGSRLSEETDSKPKPMVQIDDNPILWHIIQIFAFQGLTEFVIALGYKGEVISQWLREAGIALGDDEFELEVIAQCVSTHEGGRIKVHIKTLNTGLDAQTGGRILQCLEAYPDEAMIATYGDGLANVAINKLLAFHQNSGKLATVTAVRPAARFGFLEIENGSVQHFGEKDQANAGWINGGFFVLEPQVAKYIYDINEPFETGALPRLVAVSELGAYQHAKFFKPMDTLREKKELEELAKLTPPPWLAELEMNASDI